MDALSDPRAFMSANKERDNKLKEMGIEESEQSKAAVTGGKPAPAAEEEVKRGEFLFLQSFCNAFLTEPNRRGNEVRACDPRVPSER